MNKDSRIGKQIGSKGPDRLELIIFDITNKKICNDPCMSIICKIINCFVCDHK